MKTQTPTKQTSHRLAAVLAIATAFATTGAWAEDWTVSGNTTLTEDKTVDALTVNSGVTLDLNGYKLYCTSLAGSGTITSTGSTDLTSSSGTVTWITKFGTGNDDPQGALYSQNAISPTNLFDDDISNDNNDRILVYAGINGDNRMPLAVTYDFGEGVQKTVNKYKIYGESTSVQYVARNPQDWDFEGSNDNSTWTQLDSRRNVDDWSSNGETREYTFSNDTAYRYYRIIFIRPRSSQYLELNELEYFNTNPGELHVNIPEGGAATVGSLVISGNVKVVSEGTGSFTIDADVDVKELVFTDGASATLTVAEGKTLTTENINGIGKIINNGTIVKTGTGEVNWPFDNASTGVYVISAGRINVSKHTGADYAGSSQVIRVKNGATFDFHASGGKGLNFSVVLEDGARFANGATDAHTVSQAKGLTLEGNATVVPYRNFGLFAPGYGETTLDLGTYTLTVDSVGSFVLVKTTISGTGTILVKKGTLYATQRDSVGLDCTVSIGSEGGLNLGKNLTVKDFVNNGTISGSATLTVLGELTPGNAINKLTLADGSTVKATGTAQVVSTTFAVSGDGDKTIKVDASALTSETLRAGDVAVLTVPDTFNHSGVTWNVTGAAILNATAKWRTDEGGETKTLYVGRPTGLMIIFK